jgi:hypothetical protein
MIAAMRARLLVVAETVMAALAWLLVAVIFASLLTRDVVVALDTADRVRAHVREIEFDFVGWTLAAAGFKVSHASLGAQMFVDEEARSALVRQYFRLRHELEQAQGEVDGMFSVP